MKSTFETYYLDRPLVKGRVFDLHIPENVTKDTAVFIVHGGGWRAGSRTGFHEIMEALGNRGYIVASTDYRLDAKDAFMQLSDIREAYDRFVTILKELGRPLRIAVHGSSAGAHLGSLLLCADPGECGDVCRLENEWVKPCGGMLQATPADFLPYEAMMPQFWATMQGIAGAPYDKEPGRYERLSLKNYVRADNPPIFFMEAQREHLFPSEYTLEIARRQRAMGVRSHWKVYKDVEHGFFFELKRRAQIEAFEDVCKFMEGELETL